MAELEKLPNFAQSAANALRGLVGMGPQKTPGPATNVQSSYRQYLMDGGEMSLRDWQNSQQPAATPR